MSDKMGHTLAGNLNIIWAIASKDIVDALKNRVIVSMIIMFCIMLLIPKLLPYIFEQEQTVLPVIYLGDSSLTSTLKDASGLSIQELHSEEALKLALCGAIYPEIGLVIPANFKQEISGDDQIELQGFVCWDKRHQVSGLQSRLEELLSQSMGTPVLIRLEGNIFYPPMDGVLYLSLATINSIVLVLIIGIFLVPNLIIEEKETKTLQALLVSPASFAQVVIGKALAGLFYIMVSAVLIFLISWSEVIHWEIALLFVVGSGIFSVAVGLVLGSLFNRHQDMVGGMTAIILLLVGAVLVKTLGVELPRIVSSILPWIPSVALAEIYRSALVEVVSGTQVWTSFGIVLSISVILYVVVIFILRRSDR